MRAQAVDRQQAQREQNPPAQIRHIEHVANGGEKLFHNQVAQTLVCVRPGPAFKNTQTERVYAT